MIHQTGMGAAFVSEIIVVNPCRLNYFSVSCNHFQPRWHVIVLTISLTRIFKQRNYFAHFTMSQYPLQFPNIQFFGIMKLESYTAVYKHKVVSCISVGLSLSSVVLFLSSSYMGKYAWKHFSTV